MSKCAEDGHFSLLNDEQTQHIQLTIDLFFFVWARSLGIRRSCICNTFPCHEVGRFVVLVLVDVWGHLQVTLVGFFGGFEVFKGSLGREVSLIFMGNSGEFFIIILSQIL